MIRNMTAAGYQFWTIAMITVGTAVAALTLTACGTKQPQEPHLPSAMSTTESPTAIPTGPYTGVTAVQAKTVSIGNTGVRCLVGNVSTACVAANKPMTYNSHKRWTVAFNVQHDGVTENGFTPGTFVNTTAVSPGDLFECFGTIGYIAQAGDNATARILDQERPLRELTDNCDSFTGSFYRAQTGVDIQDGTHPATVNNWTFALAGDELTVIAGSSTWKLAI
ncbi:hypothetical protein [Mycobacteroides abscessus]|uniref:hypothetical protein n=1 Tax=Mycobacteroides abscessus TaxID=36809 RepID=UPI0009A62BFC|nr:hypothetical protein [Mycobacteroides abscessus]SLH38179.1 Uncharacterised protein [Mycobacteroides abscessus subsp. massiliense]